VADQRADRQLREHRAAAMKIHARRAALGRGLVLVRSPRSAPGVRNDV
jgi:hypothetical protein